MKTAVQDTALCRRPIATMGKKAVTNKANIMRLASSAGELPADSDNVSPVLDRSETTLFDELCTATREGDLERVAYIVSVGGPVNAVDKWQCSPLYWACRCHYPFLSQHGSQLAHLASFSRQVFVGTTM